MIRYQREDWWRTTFRLHGTVLPRVLGCVGVLTGFCLALCLLNDRVLREQGYPLPALDQLGHTVLGVAREHVDRVSHHGLEQSLLGRPNLLGAIVNASRNLSRLAGVYASSGRRSGRV